VRVCANPRRVRRGVSHGRILTANVEVVKQRRKRATDDRKVGALLKGTVRSDSVRVSETSSGWLRGTFLSMDYWLWERHTSRRERERPFIHTARRILYERRYAKVSMSWHPSTYLCLFVWVSHPNPDIYPRQAPISLASKPAVHYLPTIHNKSRQIPPPPIPLQDWPTSGQRPLSHLSPLV
jgi:hypothetical protein